MTTLLERAVQQASQLPESDQDALAALIMEEIADEAEWTAQFARSHDVLERLAEQALVEHRAGKTLPLDPDKL